MLYERLVEYYVRLEATTKRLEMTAILVELVREASTDELPLIVYLTQGKVRPEFEGVELGLADRLVSRALAEGWNVPLDRVEALYRKTGDLGEAAEEVLRKGVPRRDVTLFSFGAPGEQAKEPPPSIEEVHRAFLEIAGTSGEGSVERKKGILSRLLSRFDRNPAAAKYLVRTVTGKLRLGVADMTLVDALAGAFGYEEGTKETKGTKGEGAPVEGDDEDAAKVRRKAARAELERAYNVSSDLGRVAQAAAQGPEALAALRLEVGVPVRAMLAERLPTAAEILEKLGGSCAVEWKYDGLRVQAHRRPDGTVSFFSRRLENVTPQFPDVAAALGRAFEGSSFIVEGEVVATDPDSGEIRPFQEVTQRRRKKDVERHAESIPVTVFLFDCLLVDGEDLTSQPLASRREALTSRFRAVPGVAFSRYAVVSDVPGLERFFDEAVGEGAEGVMAKSLASPYRAGARGFQWIKFKRDYQANVTDTVDLVVVGAFAGRGRRKGAYGALLMAAYDPAEDVFGSVCKLGTGFDDATLAKLPEMLAPYLHEGPHPRVRPGLDADVWFSPGLVLEVLAFEITLSPTHASGRGALREGYGFALRFPRFTGRFREDKAPEDATSVDELTTLFKAQRSVAPAGVTDEDG
ncbi:MAG TPA: ATP-dependent DNA ligase [Candidatus Thermoplasmatota archaeon]|nr:ATP-dependent DNA ligase [Candidatus Thermoplasmatota archaeon]